MYWTPFEIGSCSRHRETCVTNPQADNTPKIHWRNNKEYHRTRQIVSIGKARPSKSPRFVPKREATLTTRYPIVTRILDLYFLLSTTNSRLWTPRNFSLSHSLYHLWFSRCLLLQTDTVFKVSCTHWPFTFQSARRAATLHWEIAHLIEALTIYYCSCSWWAFSQTLPWLLPPSCLLWKCSSQVWAASLFCRSFVNHTHISQWLAIFESLQLSIKSLHLSSQLPSSTLHQASLRNPLELPLTIDCANSLP